MSAKFSRMSIISEQKEKVIELSFPLFGNKTSCFVRIITATVRLGALSLCVYAPPLISVKLGQLASIKQMAVRLKCDSELADEQTKPQQVKK